MKDSIFFVILKNEGEKIAYWVFKELFGEGIKNVDVRHGTGAGFLCVAVPCAIFKVFPDVQRQSNFFGKESESSFPFLTLALNIHFSSFKILIIFHLLTY